MVQKGKRMISLRTVLIMVLSIFALILAVGCSSAEKKAITAPPPIEDKAIPTKIGDVPVVSMEGSPGNKLPEGYPKEIVPIMEDSTITLSSKNEDNGSNVVYWVAFTSPKAISDIRDYYQEAFKKAENVQQVEMSDEFSISGSQKDRSFTISISSDESGGQRQSIVSIMVGPKEFLEFKD